MVQQAKGFDFWIKRLSESEAVALGNTIHELNELTASDETSANELASVILRDPALTTKVLRTANSVYFNPGGTSISTVSRAIFQLGFSTLRSICLTAIMLETLLKEHPRERLLEVLAQSFHSAVQARNLCERLAHEEREEVFVAALLLRVGELLVWASQEKAVEKLHELYQETRDNRQIEAVLGVSFDRLTRGLAGQWRLSSLLNKALAPGSRASRKVVAVLLGDKLSRTVRQGVNSEEMGKLIKKVASFVGSSEAETLELVLQGVQEAYELTQAFGGEQLGNYINGSQDFSAATDVAVQERTRLEPDQRVQLQILHELNTMMQQQLSTGVLFQMILEGLHRGVGLERVALSIFDQKRSQVTAKFILGEMTADWRERFQFSFERKPGNFFMKVIERGEPCWIGHPDFAEVERLKTPELTVVLGKGEFLIAPLVVDRKEIGFLYADLRESNRALTEEYFNGFRHFALQTVICLAAMAKR